jgi:hypothetical protein
VRCGLGGRADVSAGPPPGISQARGPRHALGRYSHSRSIVTEHAFPDLYPQTRRGARSACLLAQRRIHPSTPYYVTKYYVHTIYYM